MPELVETTSDDTRAIKIPPIPEHRRFRPDPRCDGTGGTRETFLSSFGWRTCEGMIEERTEDDDAFFKAEGMCALAEVVWEDVFRLLEVEPGEALRRRDDRRNARSARESWRQLRFSLSHNPRVEEKPKSLEKRVAALEKQVATMMRGAVAAHLSRDEKAST